jgi:serine/threonine protein phosphatase PrpC
VKLRITSFGLPGSRHTESEDAFAVSPLADGGAICVLSDGVSAAREPRRCAERVVRLLADNFPARPRDWSVRKTFERLVEQANHSLYAEGAYHDGAASMQATLAAACLSGSRIRGINAGDSPVFLLRDGSIQRLSETHSRRNSDGFHVLTSAVGMSDAVTLHHFDEPLENGDIVVLASDGLTHLYQDAELGGLARKFRSARSLVRAAQELGQEDMRDLDDISAILVEVDELGPDPADEAAAADFPLPKFARGESCDGYKLLRQMGGNPRVWLAEKADDRYVLKFLPQEAETDDSGTIRARFAHEAWNACRFDADFLVPARRPRNGSPNYYVMDYVDAPSLRFLLKSRRLGIDEAIELGRFLCRSAQWLLRHELIHGDFKPDNILALREQGDIAFKLLDLGLAAPVFTDSGVSGTPTYLAPERFAGAALTERTEIYSIGATLYEMLSGRPPHGHVERFQTPSFSRLRPPSHWNRNVPPWLDAVILKCLAPRPQQRFQAYSELLFALERPESVSFSPLEQPGNSLRFYKIGFWALLITTLVLAFQLLAIHR